MALSVSHSIKQGFKAANRSISAMGVFALGWLFLLLFMVLFMSLSRMPTELLRPPEAQQTQEQTVLSDVESADSEQVDPTASTAKQEEQAQNAGWEAATVEANRRAEITLNWMAGAWPMILIALLGYFAGSFWLQAGQISYMSSMIRDSQTSISTFWIGANRAVLPLCLASLLVLGIYAVGGALVIAFFSLLGVLPGFLAVTLGILFTLSLMVGLAWLTVKLIFWFVCIVANGLGPVAGLKASFRATKGAWWRVCGLMAALSGIFFGVSLVIGIFGQLGGALGGGTSIVVSLLAMALNMVTGLYFGFFSIGALVQGYTDQTKVA